MTKNLLPGSLRTVITENFGSDSYSSVAMAAKLSSYKPSDEELLELANRLCKVCDLGSDDSNTITRHIDQLTRSPVKRSRKIIWPKTKLNVPQQFQQEFKQIQHDIETGADLSRWMSKKINHKYTDELFNNWDIHHFHFVCKTIKNRGAHRLYCLIDRDEVYFLTVSDKAEWENPELIEIAHENFQERMERFVIRGVNVLSVNAINVGNVRQRNANIFLKLDDGTIYCPPSLGITTSGLKVLSTFLADIIKQRISEGSFVLKNNLQHP